MTVRSRLDAELVRRGLARSRDHAAELIAAGRVAVAGQTAGKPATQVSRESPVTVAAPDDGEPEYVSRGGYKLAGALAAFGDLAVAGSAASTPAPPPAGSPTSCCARAPRM